MTNPLDGFAGAEPDGAPAPSRRQAVLVLAAAVVGAVLLGLVAVVALRSIDGHTERAASSVTSIPPAGPGGARPTNGLAVPATVKPTLTTTPAGTKTATPGSATAPPPPPTGAQPPPPPPDPVRPTVCTGCEIPGDGTVPVGGNDPRSVRTGQYHTDGPANGGTCSWWLAKDPGGHHQIAGKSGRQPADVVISDKTYFHSEGCLVWRWTGPA